MSPSSSAPAGLVLALLSATFYGANIVFVRLASFAGVSGSSIVFYRVLLMLGLVGLAAGLLHRRLGVDPGERSLLLIIGIATAVLGVCYSSSVGFIPVTVAVVLFYTFPVVIVLASPFVEGTPVTVALLGVVVLALVGVVLVVGPVFDALDWRGVALALAASVATAVQFFAAARCRRTGLVAKVFWIHAIVLPSAALIGLASGTLQAPGHLAAAPLAVALAIGGYAGGFLLQLAALARASAVVAGIAFCIEPMVAALTSAAVLGESLAGVQLLGGALVLVAIVANVILDQRRPAGGRPAPLADRRP